MVFFVKLWRIMVDMFRVFSNPLHDYPFRLEKVYDRYLKLEKYMEVILIENGGEKMIYSLKLEI